MEGNTTAMNRLLAVFLALVWYLPLAAAQTDYAHHIASLIDPTRLATLGERGANPRVQKVVLAGHGRSAWREARRRAGPSCDPRGLQERSRSQTDQGLTRQ